MTETIYPDNFEKNLDSFYEYLLETLALYRRLVPMLREEFGHILSDDLQALDESMKAQQALMLKVRPFEERVAEYQSRLDVAGDTLLEMASRFPREERIRFSALVYDFREALEEVNFYKEKCRVLLQSKLYHIDKALTRAESQKDNTTYDQNAAEVRSSLTSKAFETKI